MLTRGLLNHDAIDIHEHSQVENDEQRSVCEGSHEQGTRERREGASEEPWWSANQLLPDALYARTNYYPNPQTSESKVWELAMRCEHVSGRALRRVPFMALAMYVDDDACSLSQAVAAIELAVRDEMVSVLDG